MKENRDKWTKILVKRRIWTETTNIPFDFCLSIHSKDHPSCGSWTLFVSYYMTAIIRVYPYNYRFLLQNIVSFIGLFCKRDIEFVSYYITAVIRVYPRSYRACRALSCWASNTLGTTPIVVHGPSLFRITLHFVSYDTTFFLILHYITLFHSTFLFISYYIALYIVWHHILLDSAWHNSISFYIPLYFVLHCTWFRMSFHFVSYGTTLIAFPLTHTQQRLYIYICIYMYIYIYIYIRKKI